MVESSFHATAVNEKLPGKRRGNELRDVTLANLPFNAGAESLTYLLSGLLLPGPERLFKSVAFNICDQTFFIAFFSRESGLLKVTSKARCDSFTRPKIDKLALLVSRFLSLVSIDFSAD